MDCIVAENLPLAAKGTAVRWEAKKGWRVLRQRQRFRTWWSTYKHIRTDFQGNRRGG